MWSKDGCKGEMMMAKFVNLDKIIKRYEAELKELGTDTFLETRIAFLKSYRNSIESVDEGYLSDWYITSVDDKLPIWTDEHIEELCRDFYLIPKENKELL